MRECTKIGFVYVAIGLAYFAIVTILIGLTGLYIYNNSTGIAIATAVMSVMMIKACRAAYTAGKRASLPSE